MQKRRAGTSPVVKENGGQIGIMFKRFFFYGLAGWGIEMVWTGMHSLVGGDLTLPGQSNLWMFLSTDVQYSSSLCMMPFQDGAGWCAGLSGSL